MGLPAAGKTTYIGALWYILNNSSTCSLKIGNFTGDLTYFIDISGKWSNCQEIDRTLPASEKLVNEVPLDNGQGNSVTLILPDLSGESFQGQYTQRMIKSKHAEFIKDCTGVLLFLNPDKIKQSVLISEVPKHLREIGTGEGKSIENKARNPKDDSTQVQLVELLQFIAYIRNDRPVHLCIVISAWDLINTTKGNIKPGDYILKDLPLLWQYVKSNSHIFNIDSYFGISAQGGRLEESEKLLNIIDPCDRVKVVDGEGNSSKDITLPISWIMSKANE